jgi:hypothetical protein
MGLIFKKFREDPKYGDGLSDFIEAYKNKKICGNLENCSIIKYLFQHFLMFLLAFPIGIFAFYNFYFNTIYLSFIVIYLAWNTARNNIKINIKKGKTEEIEY